PLTGSTVTRSNSSVERTLKPVSAAFGRNLCNLENGVTGTAKEGAQLGLWVFVAGELMSAMWGIADFAQTRPDFRVVPKIRHRLVSSRISGVLKFTNECGQA